MTISDTKFSVVLVSQWGHYQGDRAQTSQNTPRYPVHVTDDDDLHEDDEEEGEAGCVVVEHGEPVVSLACGEAQPHQETEHANQGCKTTHSISILITDKAVVGLTLMNTSDLLTYTQH